MYGASFKTIRNYIVPNIGKPGFYKESDFVLGRRVIKWPKRLVVSEGLQREGDCLFSAIRRYEGRTIPKLRHEATAYIDLKENYGPETLTLVNYGDMLLSPRPGTFDRIPLRELIRRVDEGGLIMARECPRPSSDYGLGNLVNFQFFSFENLEETVNLPLCNSKSLERFKERLFELWKLG